MRILNNALVAVVVCAALAGCGSILGIGNQEFGCKGLPEGTQCMSAKEVYAATEHADRVSNRGISKGVHKSEPDDEAHISGGSVTRYEPEPVPSLDRPIPILSQAQVMRIWIAPWDDAEKDLHASEFVFTEVVSRKWNIGSMQIMTGSGALNPLAAGGREQKPVVKTPLAESSKK